MSDARPNAAALRHDARRERGLLFSLSAPALLLVTITMVLPVLWLFALSFLGDDGSPTVANYARLVTQPSYGRTLLATLEISALVTAISIGLGYPVAYVLSQLPPRAANLCLMGVLMPFWTSILVRTYAWLVLLQRNGLVNRMGIALGLWDAPLTLVNNLAGTLIGLVHIMLPFLVLPLYGSMRAIDPDYLKAGANLGATPVQLFWRVFLPLSLPGLAAGATLVFVISLGSYVTPAALGGGHVIMVATRIADDIQMFFSWGPASAFGAVGDLRGRGRPVQPAHVPCSPSTRSSRTRRLAR